jgi:hypothetical protein
LQILRDPAQLLRLLKKIAGGNSAHRHLALLRIDSQVNANPLDSSFAVPAALARARGIARTKL